MKVAIVAGGLGTRIREETEFRPKPMVEIGGRPILWPIIAAHGFHEFVFYLGYKREVIGACEPVSIRALVEVIPRELDASDRLDFGALETAPADASVVIADTPHLREEAGWHPQPTLAHGVSAMVHWRIQQSMRAQALQAGALS